MTKNTNIQIPAEIAYSEDVKTHLSKKFNTPEEQIVINKRSIDARKKSIKANLSITIYNKNEPITPQNTSIYKNIKNASEVHIIGAGPAGLFAALRLIELGIKPIIFERGKDVQARRRDLANINKKHIVNPESNYCFGEGGAGTYSDGKLYTRSKKRGDVERILTILVQHGAKDDILFESHPHIGTNKLPKIIQEIRETILNAGGEIHFDAKLTNLNIKSNQIKAIEINGDELYNCTHLILATGHSARDIFYLLNTVGVRIDAKPFAMGVRVEHAQDFIDKSQYHGQSRGDILPAAAYALKCQTHFSSKQRGVFSFCMCPGGFIVPAATAPGEVVVNGMSPSRRDSKFANSGIVVAIEIEDLDIKKHGVFAGLALQKEIERMAFLEGGETQVAPAQLLNDFVKGRTSNNLLETSYQPGIKSVNLAETLPQNFSKRLQFAFKHFNKIIPNYLTNEAQILGVESRTSSPIQIPRNKITLEHVNIKGLYPCGEGAGYAGGIVSAAIDGEKCAEAILKSIKK